MKNNIQIPNHHGLHNSITEEANLQLSLQNRNENKDFNIICRMRTKEKLPRVSMNKEMVATGIVVQLHRAAPHERNVDQVLQSWLSSLRQGKVLGSTLLEAATASESSSTKWKTLRWVQVQCMSEKWKKKLPLWWKLIMLQIYYMKSCR